MRFIIRASFSPDCVHKQNFAGKASSANVVCVQKHNLQSNLQFVFGNFLNFDIPI